MTEAAHCGRKIHMTAHALRAVRNTALDKNGIAFELWVVIEAIAETPEVDRNGLIGRLAEMGVHDQASAAEAIDGLHAQGLVIRTDQGMIGLTSQGKALLESVVATRGAFRNRLYGSIPSEDLATTNRVLDAIREHATAIHARQ